MSDAEVILSRIESKDRSHRLAFCLALSSLAVLVVASKVANAPDLIRTKSMQVMDGTALAASIGVFNHKVIFGVYNGSNPLVSSGEGPSGAGVLVMSGATGKDLIRLASTTSGGGSLGVHGADGVEVANASPNVTSSGSVFIQSQTGKLVGEVNGDKLNGGAIIVHDSNGTETGRVRN